MFRYFIAYKPFGMITQFSPEGDHPTLSDLNFRFPKDVYPVGRLDTDSEGLLFLTNDKTINHRLLNPKFRHQRTYLAQVDGEFHDEALKMLEKGVRISVDGASYQTLPCRATLLEPGDPLTLLPDRNPPVRYRKNIPTSFIMISLHEGKNRQVRKMTAAVGFPTLRLVRIGIGKINLDKMRPGDVLELDPSSIDDLLELK